MTALADELGKWEQTGKPRANDRVIEFAALLGLEILARGNFGAGKPAVVKVIENLAQRLELMAQHVNLFERAVHLLELSPRMGCSQPAPGRARRSETAPGRLQAAQDRAPAAVVDRGRIAGADLARPIRHAGRYVG